MSDELLLERKENRPEPKSLCQAVLLTKNSRGLYLDINKVYEAYVPTNELGSDNFADYQAGQTISVWLFQEDKNLPGVFRASIKHLEEEAKWQTLQNLQNQTLEVSITKILKSGIEVLIGETRQVAFIPFGYLDNQQSVLRNIRRENWLGLTIPAKIHELEQARNKIILNNKSAAEEERSSKAKKLLEEISIGQVVEGKVARLADFGVFLDLGGFDVLIPSSELAWRRFKKASEIVELGQVLQVKVFRIEQETNRVAVSLKQMQADPWTELDLAIGHCARARVVTHAEFGVFVEILPGVEALLHKSQYQEAPEIDSMIDVELINLDAAKKRMGVKLAKIEVESDLISLPQLIVETKELEHVN
jgi:small subunit ribosomal protein S1